MSLLSKSKKSRSRPAKNLPISVSAITQPAVENSSSLFSISSFSPRSDLFAFLSLAVDKHRLRVYDAITGQSIAEHIFETSHATSLSWISLQSLDEEEMRRTKRKKRRHHTEPETANPPSQNVCVGLADGSLILFSPSQGKAIKTLSHPASTSPILAIHHSRIRDSGMTNIWTSSADCIIRLWSLNQTRLLASWKTEERIPYSAITVSPRLPDEDQPTLDVLVANHSIHLLSFPDDNSESTSTNRQEPQKTMTCTGHASAITNVEWDSTSRFVSSAVRDRFLYVWDIPGPSSDALSPSEGRVVASIPLDSDVRSFCLSQPPVSTPSASRIQRLLALSTSGNLLLFSLSSEIISPAPSDGARVVTLKPNATITTQPAKRNEEPRTIQIVAATFIPDNEGKLRVARMTAGVKVSFDIVTYLDKTGNILPDVRLTTTTSGTSLNDTDDAKGAPNQRYTESASVAVRSGAELGQDTTMDDTHTGDIDGELDVDMAELTLGQRLTALEGLTEGTTVERSDSDEREESTRSKDAEARTINAEASPTMVPASSLTRTLIQALHSSDAGLLEACLTHTNATLIQNTVQRLPPQLAVPLISACVERLGRGKGVGRGKGGGAAAGAQRATGLVRWVRTVLVVHGGHLLTMPDLVARLAGLHTTLTTRLTLQDSLHSLSGRLDMVISQIELRSSGAPAPLPLTVKRKGKGKAKLPQANSAKPISKYVEGESEDEEPELAGMDVEVESAEEEGSLEDVELGGSEEDEDDAETSEDEVETDENEEEDVEEDSDAAGGPKVNGFLDDEAEEYSADEDEDDSE